MAGKTIQSVLGLDISQFRRAAAAASATLGGVASEAKSQFGDLGNQIFGGLTATGAAYYLQSVASEMDNIGKSSRRVGVDVQSWQYLAEAFKRGDSSAQDLEVGLRKLKDQMATAMETNDQASVFAKLGLDFKALQGLSPDQLMLRVAEAINALPSKYEKAAAAQEFFGRNGEKVLDSLVSEYENIKSWMDANQLVISDKAIESAMAYNDQLENMQKQLQSLAANSGIFSNLAEHLAEINAMVTNPQVAQKKADQGATGLYADSGYAVAQAMLPGISGLIERWGIALQGGSKEVYREGVTADEQKRLDEYRAGREAGTKKTPSEENADKAAEAAKLREDAKKKAVNDSVQGVVDKMQLEAQKAQGGGKLSAEVEAQAEINALQKAHNQDLDEEQKKRIRNAAEIKKTAEAAAELAKAQKKLAESLDGKYAGMRETLLEAMGKGQEAAIERSMREAEKAKGAPLDEAETARATKAGKLEYQIANLKQQAAALPELEMSDMTRANGGAILESSAMEQINQDILAESKTASQLLQQLNDKFDGIGKVGN